MFSNFKKRDQKGRRLSIFGRLVDNEIEIFVLTCSKHDAFNKKLAITIYKRWIDKLPAELEGVKYHPTIYSIAVKDKDEAAGTFLFHCENEYCSCYPSYGIVKFHYLTENQADKLRYEYADE